MRNKLIIYLTIAVVLVLAIGGLLVNQVFAQRDVPRSVWGRHCVGDRGVIICFNSKAEKQR